MSGGQQEANKSSVVFTELALAEEHLEQAFDLGGYDRAFGPNQAVIDELNETFARYGLELRRKR